MLSATGYHESKSHPVNFQISDEGVLSLKPNEGQWVNEFKPGDIYCNIIEAKIVINGVDGGYRTDIASPTEKEKANVKKEVIFAYYPIEIVRLLEGDNYIPTMLGGYGEVIYSGDGTNPQYENNAPFSCDDNFDTPEVKESYEYTWSCQESNLIKIDKADIPKNVKTINPVKNFQSGNTNNYVKTQLKLTAKKRNELNAKKSEIETEINNLNIQIEIYEDIIKYIANYIQYHPLEENNKGFNYEGILNILKAGTNFSFLIKRYKIINKLEDLEGLLKLIVDFLDQYPEFKKNVSIKDRQLAANETIDQILLKEIESAKNVLFNCLLETTNSFKPVSQLTFDTKSNDRAKVNKISEYIEMWNSIVNTYSLMIKDFSSKTFYTSFTKILEAWIKNLKDYTPFNSRQKQLLCEKEYEKFSSLIEKIEQIKKNLYYCYTYEDIDIKILTEINNAISSYYNTYYAQTAYEEKIQECNDTIPILQDELNGYIFSLSEESTPLIIIKPIVMLFNRYEKSFLNEWNGDKIYINDKDTSHSQYIMSPMVGAGRKEDGKFTGITIGMEEPEEIYDPSHSVEENINVGLLGYSEGVRSIFLNARTGSATFGKSGGGQVVIDPKNNKAQIYSSNYMDTSKNQGTCIDLKDGWIHFKSATEGKIYSGQHDTLSSNQQGFYLSHSGLSVSSVNNGKEIARIELSTSGQPKIFSNEKSSLGNGNDGFYLGNDGLSIGSKVYINNNGLMKLGSRAVGTSDSTCWTISGDVQKDSTGKIISEESYIKYNNSGATNSVYISTSKITLGANFLLQNDGVMKIGSNAVSGGSYCWTIDSHTEGSGSNIKQYSHIRYGDKYFESSNLDNKGSYSINGSDNQVYLGIDGIRLGSRFAVDNNGNLVAKHLIAKDGGNIGGWTIGANTLTGADDNGKKIVISAQGDISGGTDKGNKWSIDRSGEASFNKVTITGGSLTLGSTTIDESSFSLSQGNSSWSTSAGFNFSRGANQTSFSTSGGFVGAGSASYGSDTASPFSGTCVTHIETLAADHIIANMATLGIASVEQLNAVDAKIDSLEVDKLKVSKQNVTWKELRVITDYEGKDMVDKDGNGFIGLTSITTSLLYVLSN